MDYDQFDSIQLLSVSDFIEVYYHMLKSAMETSAEEAAKYKNGFDGNLLEDDARNLLEYCERSQVPLVSQALAELLTCLERNNEKKSPEVRETAIYNTLLRLEKAVDSTSTWELCDLEYHGPLFNLTSFEEKMIEQQMSLYLEDLLVKNCSQTLFFPLTDFYSSDAIVKWRILEKIVTIKLFAVKPEYKQKLKLQLSERLKKEVNDWLTREIEKLKLTGTSSILKNTEAVSKILRDLRSQVTTAIDVITSETLFDESGCKYFEVLAETVDEMLFPVCVQVMEVMDIYQARHRDFVVNMRDSCALSHALYLQLKKLTNLLIAQGKTERHLKLHDYTCIFSKFFTNLLQVMKMECHNRIKRAVQAEMKDSVHFEEQILSSSVIVLNCMCTVIDEWKHMEVEEAEQKIAFLVKITDIVCDGAKIFAECLERRLEWMTFPVKDTVILKKVCVLANSIEHVLQYMQELPHQMQWSQVLENVGEDLSDDTLKEQVLRILNLIHQSMNTHMAEIITKMLNIVAGGVHNSTEKVFLAWLQSQATNQAFERYLAHLNEVLENLHETLKEQLFSQFISLLWSFLITCIQKNFQEGLPPEYAKTVKDNIFSLKDYFLQGGMTDLEVHKPHQQQLMDLLDLNLKTTEDLQLDYYVQIAESIVSPVEYLGHIAFQAGYKTVGDEWVDLYINVQKGQRLPARKFEMSHLVVKLELCPGSLFPSQVPFKSLPVTEDLDNPVFNELFQFSKLPSSVLNVKGAVVQVLVLNQDYSFSAEAILLLNQVQNMSGIVSLEFLPVYLMPLRKFDMSHICYQVLENRSRWDKNAKYFINKRAKLSKQKTRLSCIPGNIMCNFARND